MQNFCCLVKSSTPEDGSVAFFRNVGKLIPDYSLHVPESTALPAVILSRLILIWSLHAIIIGNINPYLKKRQSRFAFHKNMGKF